MTLTLLVTTGVGSAETCQTHVDHALARNLPVVTKQPARKGKLAIVGGGPSVPDYLTELESADEIWAIGATFDWLCENGVIPHAFVACDPQDIVADYLRNPRMNVRYYLASVCHPAVYSVLDGLDVFIWHARDDELKFPPGSVGIGGGCSCATRAPFLAHVLGWRDLSLYGVDSSFVGERTHVDDRSKRSFKDNFGQYLQINVGGAVFTTAINLVHQATHLCAIKELFDEGGWADLKIRCGGMMGELMRAPIHNFEDFKEAS